jgi:predicted Zn finger-like uncharacterized protein
MAGLATRCPACDTVFRVVPDQLRVSEGWVRCGRCAEVFNASESLLDLDSGAPSAMPGTPTMPAAAPPPTSRTPAAVALEAAPAAPPAEPAPEPWPEAEPVPEPEPDWPPSFTATGIEPPAASAAEPVEAAAPAEPAELPSFVRRAERAARWRQPRVRAALAAVGVLAAVGLAAQAAFQYRDLVAARHAAVRPALDRGCALLGCTVAAPRLIDSLAVESSGLVRVERSSLYKLSVALRNRDAFEVAVPALDLRLTDAQGKLLARRVLRAAELGASQAALGAGRDLSLQATLQAATEPVAGYTIELFYP